MFITKLSNALELLVDLGVYPINFARETAEDLFTTLQSKHKEFNFIFCANVVEHVINLPRFFDSIIPLISQNGTFRFVCPNYAIPYEPHFGFLTLFSKKLTYKFQKRKIEKKL